MQRSDFTLYPLSRIHFASFLIGLKGRQRCYSLSSAPPYLISSWYVVPAPAHWASYHGGCKNLAAHCIFLQLAILLSCWLVFVFHIKYLRRPICPCRRQHHVGSGGRQGRKEGNPLFSLWNGAALCESLCELGQHITEWLQFFKTGYHSDGCEWVEVSKEGENERLEFITLSITE